MFHLRVVILDSGCTLEVIWGFWQIIDTGLSPKYSDSSTLYHTKIHTNLQMNVI